MAACKTMLMSRFSFSNFLVPRNLLINYSHNEHISQKVVLKLGLPKKPKKPMTPFFKYMGIVRPKLIQENINLKPTEIAKKVAEEWKKIDEKEKKELQNQYDIEMVDYVKNMIKYEQSLTLQQRDAIKDFKNQEKIESDKRAMKKKLRSLNKPKKPVNSFMLYMTEQLEHKDPNQKYSDWRIETIKKWHEIPQEKKMEYMKKFKTLYKKYESDLNQWEAEMIRSGHLDIIRTKSQIEDVKK